MEDSYTSEYSINSIEVSSIAQELEDFLESLPPDPLSRRGTEGVLCIKP